MGQPHGIGIVGLGVISRQYLETPACRPGIRIVWQQARVALRDMEYDRPGLEQAETAFFKGRNLSKRVKRQMCGFFHCLE